MIATCFVLSLSGCGGGGGGASAVATGTTTGGGAIKGPLDCRTQGSVIATGSSGKTATGSTPSVGSFSADMTGLTFPVTVVVSGCMDTITGASQEFDLSTMVMDPTQTVINATPLSTLAVAAANAAKVGGGTITQADLDIATANVLNAFGLSASLATPVTGVYKTAAEVTNLALACEAVAEVIKRSATAAPGGASTANIVASFAADLADGALDGATLAGVTIPVPIATAAGVNGNLIAKVFDEVAAGHLVISQVDPLTGVVMNVLPLSAFNNAVSNMATATSGTVVTAATINQAATPTSVNAKPPAKPVITLTGANPLTVAQGSVFTDPGSSVTDNVDTGLTATVTGTVNTAIVGTYTLTYNVSDAAGNAATIVTRTVNVTDQTAPVISLTGANPLTVAQGSVFSDPGSSVTDNVDVGLTATVTGTVNTATVGTYTLTYNISDAAGNAATAVTRTVNVTDQMAPVITLTGANPLTVAQGSVFTDPGSSVTDNVDTGLAATVTGTVNTVTVGTYTLTYNVSDAAGNAATAVTRTVNVTDQTAPVIALTGANPLTVAQGSVFTDPGSSVTDNVDTGLTATVTGTVNTAIVGTYTLTYNVSDAAGNAATAVARTVNVTAPAGSLSIAAASVIEGSGGGVTNLNFTVTLSAASTGAVSVDYATTDGTALSASDYTVTAATLTIVAGNTTGTITVSVGADTLFEPNETLTLTLSNSVNATITTAVATGTILNDDVGGLNDTGITTWGNATVNNLTVTQTLFPGQDADHGRDALAAVGTLIKTGGGKAGFDFTKLDAAGQPLANQAAIYAVTPWSCVQDNVTGLMWEVKTTTAGLHSKNNSYSWYNSTGINNGGNAGAACPGVGCTDDTEKYVAAVNAAGLCGFNDWRLPKKEALRSIVDLSVVSPGPTIDTGYFPNTMTNSYWSASPDASNAAAAWGVYFRDGGDVTIGKGAYYYVRVVRGGQ